MGSLPDGVGRALAGLPAWTWALPVALCLAVGFRAGLRLARRLLARRSARARRLGAAGAARALDVLRRAGFAVRATEVCREGVLELDGRPERFTVRADALVERRGTVWVAEVKGGEGTATVHDRATRRQLLEYAHVFGAEGVLLVDARRGRVHVVRFPQVAPGTPVAGTPPRAARRAGAR